MYSIITATILLGLVHALIPNHWLPLVAVAKAEKWERPELLKCCFYHSVGSCCRYRGFGDYSGNYRNKASREIQ